MWSVSKKLDWWGKGPYDPGHENTPNLGPCPFYRTKLNLGWHIHPGWCSAPSPGLTMHRDHKPVSTTGWGLLLGAILGFKPWLMGTTTTSHTTSYHAFCTWTVGSKTLHYFAFMFEALIGQNKRSD